MKKAVPFPFEQVKGDPFPNSEYYEYGDYKIHYRVDPAKTVTPVAKAFLLHGFACNTRFFDEMVERLTAEGISCLRADLPDFGFSTREKKGIHYVPQAEILAQMMKDFDEDGTGWILFGHSMGGSVSLQMAQAEENADEKEINALVLYAPLLMRDSPERMRKFMMDGPVGKILETVLPYATPYDGLWKFIGYLMTFDKAYTKAMDPGLYRDALQVRDMGYGGAYMTAVASIPDIERLKTLKLPIQLIFAGKDVFVMPPAAIKLWKRMPAQTDKHFFANAAHCFLQNQADRTWKTTKKFLQKNGQI